MPDAVPDADLPNPYQVELPGWTATAFLAFVLLLIPWIIWLGIALPSRHTDHLYDVTWVGFDVGLLAALTAVMISAHRRSTYVEITSTIAGTMLLVDAWFDITTSSPGSDRWEAIIAAVLFELPIAALCLWLSRNAESVRRRRDASLVSRLNSTR